MRFFHLGLHCLPTRHAFVSHQYIGSLLFFGKIYLSAHMITVLKQNRPLISLHNVCMSGAKALLRLHTQVCIGTEA